VLALGLLIAVSIALSPGMLVLRALAFMLFIDVLEVRKPVGDMLFE